MDAFRLAFSGKRQLTIRQGAANENIFATALAFASLAGVDADPSRWPDLEDLLLHGPLTPSSFRLQGPDCCPDAPARLRAEAVAGGFSTKRL
jgi:hypothetical protein